MKCKISVVVNIFLALLFSVSPSKLFVSWTLIKLFLLHYNLLFRCLARQLSALTGVGSLSFSFRTELELKTMLNISISWVIIFFFEKNLILNTNQRCSRKVIYCHVTCFLQA